MGALQIFQQYYADELQLYRSRLSESGENSDYIALIRLRQEIFGVYKFIKRMYPDERYALTDFYMKIETEMNQMIFEADKAE